MEIDLRNSKYTQAFTYHTWILSNSVLNCTLCDQFGAMIKPKQHTIIKLLKLLEMSKLSATIYPTTIPQSHFIC